MSAPDGEANQHYAGGAEDEDDVEPVLKYSFFTTCYIDPKSNGDNNDVATCFAVTPQFLVAFLVPMTFFDFFPHSCLVLLAEPSTFSTFGGTR